MAGHDAVPHSPRNVDPARQESLEMLDAGSFQSFELGSLNNPFARKSLDNLGGIRVKRQVIRKPFGSNSQRRERRRFVGALAAFQYQHLVKLAPWLPDAAHSGHQHQRANRARVLVTLDTRIGRQPTVKSRLLIPGKPIEVVTDWMEWRVAR